MMAVGYGDYITGRRSHRCRSLLRKPILFLATLSYLSAAMLYSVDGGSARPTVAASADTRPTGDLPHTRGRGIVMVTASRDRWQRCRAAIKRAREGNEERLTRRNTPAGFLAFPGNTARRLSDLCPSFADTDGRHLVRDLKMALAGALAGAVATAALFPIDTAKTLRQANPHTFHGTREALAHICRTRGPLSVYTGLPTAVIGAMPSSALYFGTYEAVKTRLLRAATRAFPAGSSGRVEGVGAGEGGCRPAARAAAHALAAACGNAASSLVFVPKEFVKQTLQTSGMAAAGSARENAQQIVQRTLREKGVQGLYRGYWATLSRNIPSAVIRFSLYEELKLLLGPQRLSSAPPVFLLAGALAGACASGLTTPFDVLKTRVATGSLDGSRGFASNMASIVAEDGWKGLYAGFQPRVVMSALFTAVGFGSFEFLKALFGVSPLPTSSLVGSGKSTPKP